MRVFVASLMCLAALAGNAWAQTSLLGGPAIVEAAKFGDTEGVRGAIARADPVNDTDADRMTALMHAAKSGYADIVAMLLQANASHRRRNEGGATALNLAAGNGHLQVVQILLAAGANPDIPDKQGFTPLIRAVRRGHVGVVESLIAHEADLGWNDYTGLDALDWAKRSRQDYIAEMLKRAGAR